MSFVYKADPARGRRWAEIFARRAPQYDFRQWPDIGDPARVRFLAAWQPPEDLRGTLPNLEVLFSSGAGVDQFDLSTLPPDLPLVRMVEPGIIGGMVEYVTWAVLGLHRDMPQYRRQQQRGEWSPLQVVAASERRVGVLGLGQLGQAVLGSLRRFGFDCAGWSRSRHAIEGVQCHAGPDELPAFLERTNILVHVGRGQHLVARDLLAALDSGRIAEAVLDVTDPEPLPPVHAFWQHPRITLTPHIASMTDPDTAAEAVLDNLRRHESGEPMIGLVDRAKGY
jgi:glyoxylate/hydroxypyruvate reductase A